MQDLKTVCPSNICDRSVGPVKSIQLPDQFILEVCPGQESQDIRDLTHKGILIKRKGPPVLHAKGQGVFFKDFGFRWHACSQHLGFNQSEFSLQERFHAVIGSLHQYVHYLSGRIQCILTDKPVQPVVQVTLL